MKFIPPFPKGHINPILKAKGFQESDILEIRKILTDEIKRQNEDEK